METGQQIWTRPGFNILTLLEQHEISQWKLLKQQVLLESQSLARPLRAFLS